MAATETVDRHQDCRRLHRRRHGPRRRCHRCGVDGLAGPSYIQGAARQPEAQGRLQTIFFLTVGLVEAMYFINLAFMALFVFVLGAKQ